MGRPAFGLGKPQDGGFGVFRGIYDTTLAAIEDSLPPLGPSAGSKPTTTDHHRMADLKRKATRRRAAY